MDQLRKLLKTARVEQGASLEDLASTLQVPPEALLALEAGGPIEADVLFGLVNLLNISPETVMPLIGELGWDVSGDSEIESLVGRRARG